MRNEQTENYKRKRSKLTKEKLIKLQFTKEENKR